MLPSIIESRCVVEFGQDRMLSFVGVEFKSNADMEAISLTLHPNVDSNLKRLMNSARAKAHGLHPFAGAKHISAETLGRPFGVTLRRTGSDRGNGSVEEVAVFHSKAESEVQALLGDEAYAVIVRGEHSAKAGLDLSLLDRNRNKIVNEALPYDQKAKMFWDLRTYIEIMAIQAMALTIRKEYSFIVGEPGAVDLRSLSSSLHLMLLNLS